jgi:DNA-binding GntR family transcriptional regulator
LKSTETNGLSKNKKKTYVLEAMRKHIIEGLYPQGLKLIEKDLAEEFGVSRPLLREVLNSLENQGLVERIPNRGAMVRRVEPESLINIMEIREVLEGLAARLAAQKSKPQDWLEFATAFAEPATRMVEKQEFESYLKLVASFRERIVKAAGNPELSLLIYSLYDKIIIIQRRVVILPGRLKQAINEHRAVLKALMAQDADLAEQKKRENLRSAKEFLMKYKTWIL